MPKTTAAPPEIALRPGMSADEIFDAYGLTCPPRVGTLRNPERKTYGHVVAKVARQLGTPFMPWQRYVADVALEVNPQTGALQYRDVTLLVPRQSGKTTLILAIQTHRALYMGREAYKHRPAQGRRQRILYAAQNRNAAREKFVQDQVPILQDSPLRKRFELRLSNGSEGLTWDTGANFGITANTETAGHGKTLDLGTEDEFFAAEDFRMEQAYSPAMITRWSPQHWRVSTEGTVEKSLYLAAKVELGREIVESGRQSATCYIEFSDLGGDRNDPETWLGCMPALCPAPVNGTCRCSPDWQHTVTVDVIAAESEKLDPAEFDRAYLNRRRGLRAAADPNVPSVEAWAARANPAAVCGPDVAIAVDISPARDKASIGVVGAGDGELRHVELIENRPGVDWLIARIKQLHARWNPLVWVLDGTAPVRSLLIEMEQAGIKRSGLEPKRGELWVMSTQEFAAACGAYTDAVRSGTVQHPDQPEMAAALAVAKSRPVNDSYRWARRLADGDITPLVVGTLAVAGYESRKFLADINYDAMDNIW